MLLSMANDIMSRDESLIMTIRAERIAVHGSCRAAGAIALLRAIAESLIAIRRRTMQRESRSGAYQIPKRARTGQSIRVTRTRQPRSEQRFSARTIMRM